MIKSLRYYYTKLFYNLNNTLERKLIETPIISDHQNVGIANISLTVLIGLPSILWLINNVIY